MARTKKKQQVLGYVLLRNGKAQVPGQVKGRACLITAEHAYLWSTWDEARVAVEADCVVERELCGGTGDILDYQIVGVLAPTESVTP